MKKIINIYVRFVQRILITILLSVLYLLAFSITKMFMIIITNKYYRRKFQNDTYWIKAEGYEADIETAMVQS